MTGSAGDCVPPTGDLADAGISMHEPEPHAAITNTEDFVKKCYAERVRGVGMPAGEVKQISYLNVSKCSGNLADSC